MTFFRGNDEEEKHASDFLSSTGRDPGNDAVASSSNAFIGDPENDAIASSSNAFIGDPENDAM